MTSVPALPVQWAIALGCAVLNMCLLAGMLAVSRASERRFRLLVEGVNDHGLFLLDRAGRIASWNPGAERITGYRDEDVLGHHFSLLQLPQERHPDRLDATLQIAADRGSFEDEGCRLRKDGTRFHANVLVSALYDDKGEIQGYAHVIRDITERQHLLEQLEHHTLHDPLTGLPNRTLLLDRAQQALSRLARDGGHVAMLLLDLDRFKAVNDGLGHDVGDELIASVADRLRTAVRPGDTLARLGGDEFVILCVELPDEVTATTIANRLLRLLEAPFTVGGRETFLNASVGISLADSEQEGGALLRRADAAMYQAKARGGGRIEVFGEGLTQRAFTRLELETDLRHALERGQLRVVYQPIVALDDGRLDGFEALARWEHPSRGAVPPAEFIPLAEETGLIVPIGEWVLRTACRQAVRWSALGSNGFDGFGAAAPRMSVNVSARQVTGSDLPTAVSRALADTGLDADRLCLELTESVVIGDAESSLATLGMIRGLGVGLAVDDFGTGYSSLSYLKRLPVDRIKLDRSFVAAVDQAEDAAIVAGVVHIADALGLEVVAEGVEDGRQLYALRDLGCGHAQGYHLARPQPPEAFDQLVRSRQRRPAVPTPA